MRSNLTFRRKYHTCSICNEVVELETAKTDESGKPVHEECYVARVALNTMRPQSNEVKAVEVRKTIARLA